MRRRRRRRQQQVVRRGLRQRNLLDARPRKVHVEEKQQNTQADNGSLFSSQLPTHILSSCVEDRKESTDIHQTDSRPSPTD